VWVPAAINARATGEPSKLDWPRGQVLRVVSRQQEPFLREKVLRGETPKPESQNSEPIGQGKQPAQRPSPGVQGEDLHAACRVGAASARPFFEVGGGHSPRALEKGPSGQRDDWREVPGRKPQRPGKRGLWNRGLNRPGLCELKGGTPD